MHREEYTPLYKYARARAIHVNAYIPFYVVPQNSRQLDTCRSTVNQRIIKSYENAVAFFDEIKKTIHFHPFPPSA